MTLTGEQLAQYQRDGFLVIENFVTDAANTALQGPGCDSGREASRIPGQIVRCPVSVGNIALEKPNLS